jgi:PAS domain S-box-containing protein
MDVILTLWLLLGLFISGLSIFSFRLYVMDKDKRKLMFGLGLLFSSMGFYIVGFGYETYGPSTYFTSLLNQWGATAYIILLFYVLLELLFKEKINLNLIFKFFLGTLILSFIVLASQTISPTIYGMFMGLGTVIILFFSIASMIRDRSVSSFLFFLSITSLLISTSLLIQIDETTTILSYFSLFAFFTGYSFIGLLFLASPLESKAQSGIKSYFSIERKLEQTRKELQDTQQTFYELFNQMIDAVVIVNKKGKILEASQKLFNDFEVKRDEVIGQNFLNMPFFDAKTKRQLIKNILLRFTGKHIPPYEITAYSKGGKPLSYEIHAGRIKYKGKTADMAVFRDLRERKKVEKSLHDAELKYQTIFEKTGAAIGTFADDSVITLVNSEFETLTGYSKKEVEHKMHWYDFIAEEERQKLFEYHKKRSQNNSNIPTEYTTSIVDKRGIIKQVQVNIGLIPETSLRIVSLIDITQLKQVQTQLESVNKDLESKVNERTQRIQQLLKQKDEFINQLGHDLKNPLGPLINLIPILEKREKDPRYKEMFQVLNRNINYMKNLVVKTIKLAKLNSPNTEFHMQETNLNDLIDDVISANALLFEEKSIHVINNITSTITLSVDSLQIQELFVNLFNNAVKYSEGKGNIIVDASVNEGEVIFSIKDDGVGMSEDQIQHVFDEFYKADMSRHDFDSSGLGMPIAKRIVEKHGGRIWAESEGLGEGSTINFSLPFQPTFEMNDFQYHKEEGQDIGSKVDLLISK